MFRIVDLRADPTGPEVHIEAGSPEAAAELALGVKVYRAGLVKNLVCRAYWQSQENLNMVRLYGDSRVRDG